MVNDEDLKVNTQYGVDQVDSLEGLEAVKSCRPMTTLQKLQDY